MAAPRLWSAETPHLYRLVVALIDPRGEVVEASALRIGFRSVEVRGLTLDDGAAGLRVRAADGGPLEFSASHYTADDLFAAHHTFDLRPRAETILNLDYRQRGLGTASCGPDALDRYRITPGRYVWSYVLEPSPQMPFAG